MIEQDKKHIFEKKKDAIKKRFNPPKKENMFDIHILFD